MRRAQRTRSHRAGIDPTDGVVERRCRGDGVGERAGHHRGVRGEPVPVAGGAVRGTEPPEDGAEEVRVPRGRVRGGVRPGHARHHRVARARGGRARRRDPAGVLGRRAGIAPRPMAAATSTVGFLGLAAALFLGPLTHLAIDGRLRRRFVDALRLDTTLKLRDYCRRAPLRGRVSRVRRHLASVERFVHSRVRGVPIADVLRRRAPAPLQGATTTGVWGALGRWRPSGRSSRTPPRLDGSRRLRFFEPGTCAGRCSRTRSAT